MSGVSGWCLPDAGTQTCHDHEECERRGCVCDCPRHDRREDARPIRQDERASSTAPTTRKETA